MVTELEAPELNLDELDESIALEPQEIALKGIEEIWPIPTASPTAYDSDHDVTDMYLRGLSKKLLTGKEEIELAHKIAKGDRKAFDHMVEANLRLVVNLARRYTGRGLPLIDLIAEGNLGLMRAAEKFNPDLGFRFSTYATWWIKQSIERGLFNQARTIRIPIHVMKELRSYMQAIEQYRQQHSKEASAEDLAKIMGKSVREVKKALTACKSMESLDYIKEDGDRAMLEVLAEESEDSPEESFDRAELRQVLLQWLDELSVPQRTVLSMRFGLNGDEPMTLEDIGEQIGLTRERVRQIQLEALKALGELAKESDFCYEDLL